MYIRGCGTPQLYMQCRCAVRTFAPPPHAACGVHAAMELRLVTMPLEFRDAALKGGGLPMQTTLAVCQG